MAAPQPAPAAVTAKQTRNKKSWACVECRRRKKLCDRNVPRCNQCVARGMVDACRWGDERDDGVGIATPVGQDASLTPVSRKRQRVENGDGSAHTSSPQDVELEEEDLVQELQRGGMQLLTTQPFAKRPRCEATANPAIHMTFDQAETLVDHFVQGECLAFIFDYQLVQRTLREASLPHSPYFGRKLVALKDADPELYAFVLCFCTTALISLPPTYAAALGIVPSGGDLLRFVTVLHHEAQGVLNAINRPSFVALQALNLIGANLGYRVCDDMVGLDAMIRIARRLGLDRLGTVEDDEARWRAMDIAPGTSPPAAASTAYLSAHNEVSWSAQTFQRRDRRARNLGRMQWIMLCSKDWIHAPMHGSYIVSPASYTTGVPACYRDVLAGTQDLSATQCESVNYVYFGADVLRRFADIVSEADAYGQAADYGRVLELDRLMVDTLTSLPHYLRINDVDDIQRLPEETRGVAIVVTSSLWHRLCVIHRPFILLSRADPRTYGRSSERSWRYALLVLQVSRREEGLLLHKVAWVFRLVQAAHVLVAHLFFRSAELSRADVMQVHDYVEFVVATTRRIENGSNPRSPFAGQAQKLEAILASASRLQSTRAAAATATTTTRRTNRMREGSPTAMGGSESCASVAAAAAPPSDSALDEHLLRILWGLDVRWTDAGAGPERAAAPDHGPGSEPSWSSLLDAGWEAT